MKKTENKSSNRHIVKLLRFVAAAYLLQNENRFKILAYEKAADTIDHLDRELKDIWQENQLTRVPGIGASIGAHLSEYFTTGESKHFNEVFKDIPESVFTLMSIPSIGPKTAFKLVKELKLVNPNTAIKDLKKAGKNNKIAKISTFGEKSQKEILEAIDNFENRMQKEERMPLEYAFVVAERITDYLKKNNKIKRIDVLGSLRRMVATIGDIDIAVSADIKDTEKILEYFVNYPRRVKVDNKGPKKASIIVHPYVRVDLRVQEMETYGSMLQYFTGSKAHNIKLRDYALSKGYSLSEYGMKIVKNPKIKEQSDKVKKFKTEEEFYKFLGIEWIPPELREGTNEIDKAQHHQLPHLVELKDIKGDFHMHSNYNLKPSHDSGADSYEQMTQKAIDLGYKYIGFTDHNPSMSTNFEDEIISIMKKRKEYIDQIFTSNKFDQIKHFVGLEVDILPTGKLALPEKAFEYVDYLIVSVHSSFQMDAKSMTERVLAGLNHPKVKILGHPTGRLLTKREGYDLIWSNIFKFCKESNKAIEINAWPARLDLPDILVREAINQGVKLVVNTDSHAMRQMDNMFFGVAVARRGWAKKSDIVNAMMYNEIKEWITK